MTPNPHLTHVEDFLEVVVGVRDPVSGRLHSQFWHADSFNPIISLARYDVEFLKSTAEQANLGTAFTVKQGDLLCSIMLKYQKQLAAKCIDVEPLRKPQWRRPLRVIDYSKTMTCHGTKIHCKFPYNNNMITGIRSMLKQGQGHGRWDSNLKVWVIDITEYNVNWLAVWGRALGFDIDPQIQIWAQEIQTIETQAWPGTELTTEHGKLALTQAPDSLINYINHRLTSDQQQDPMIMANLSAVCGYRVDEEITMAIQQHAGLAVATLIMNRCVKINNGQHSTAYLIDLMTRYAGLVGYPEIFVYNPQYLESLNQYRGCINGVEVTHLEQPIQIDMLPKAAPVICGLGMMHRFGLARQAVLTPAEKIVYYTNEVFSESEVIDIDSQTNNQRRS